jgi:hypothetical protein
MEFHGRLTTPGKWAMARFQLRFKCVTITWTFPDIFSVIIIKPKRPNVSVTYPTIVTADAKVRFVFDLVNTYAVIGIRIASKHSAIPQQNGVATLTYSDGEQEVPFEFHRDELKIASPFRSVCSLELKCLLTEVDTELLSVTLSVDQYQFFYEFPFVNDFPVKLEARLFAQNLYHLQLTNISQSDLFVSNDVLEEVVLPPKKSRFLIHEMVRDEFTLVVRQKDRIAKSRSWVLDGELMSGRFEVEIGQDPLITGKAVLIELKLPDCEYQIEDSTDVLVVGRTKANNCPRGNVRLWIVPLKVGILKMPRVRINGVPKPIYPLLLHATATSALSAGPFLRTEV